LRSLHRKAQEAYPGGKKEESKTERDGKIVASLADDLPAHAVDAVTAGTALTAGEGLPEGRSGIEAAVGAAFAAVDDDGCGSAAVVGDLDLLVAPLVGWVAGGRVVGGGTHEVRSEGNGHAAIVDGLAAGSEAALVVVQGQGAASVDLAVAVGGLRRLGVLGRRRLGGRRWRRGRGLGSGLWRWWRGLGSGRRRRRSVDGLRLLLRGGWLGRWRRGLSGGHWWSRGRRWRRVVGLGGHRGHGAGLALVEERGIRSCSGGRLDSGHGRPHGVVLDVDLGLGGIGALVEGSSEGEGAAERSSEDGRGLHGGLLLWLLFSGGGFLVSVFSVARVQRKMN
jgi:hypothetical protein